MDKWMWVAFAILFISIGIGDVVQKQASGECRTAAINKGMSAADVKTACDR